MVKNMSDSYPTIQESLSDMQKEFMGCVEMHLDPPEGDETTYRVEATYRHDSADTGLPGDGLRFAVTVDERDPEISERRHTVEFVELADDGSVRPVARVLHSMKRVEASKGRFFWTESSFKVAGPDTPEGSAPASEVEHEVRLYVDRVKALDRARTLAPV